MTRKDEALINEILSEIDAMSDKDFENLRQRVDVFMKKINNQKSITNEELIVS
jgi:hypothetical protein